MNEEREKNKIFWNSTKEFEHSLKQVSLLNTNSSKSLPETTRKSLKEATQTIKQATGTNNSIILQPFESDNSLPHLTRCKARTSIDTEESIQNSSFNETSTPENPVTENVGSRNYRFGNRLNKVVNENWQPQP